MLLLHNPSDYNLLSRSKALLPKRLLAQLMQQITGCACVPMAKPYFKMTDAKFATGAKFAVSYRKIDSISVKNRLHIK